MNDEYEHLRESADADRLPRMSDAHLHLSDLDRPGIPFQWTIAGVTYVGPLGRWLDADRHSEARAGGRHLLGHDYGSECDMLSTGEAAAMLLYEPVMGYRARMVIR